jgi:hypothetical protein
VTDVQEELVRRSEALGLHPQNLRDVIQAVNQGRHPMYALVLTQTHREALDAATQYLVTQCRAANYTWTAIGDALGMTKQGAQQKYGVNGA